MEEQNEMNCKQLPLEISSSELKDLQLVLDSARLMSANKARALEVLESMLAKLNANSVVRVSNTKEVY